MSDGQRSTINDQRSPPTADRRSLAAHPSARGLVAAILAALEDGDSEAAADGAAAGQDAFPDAAIFHRLRGFALFALGATEEAQGHLRAALAVDPLDNAAQAALARVADALGDPYTAAEELLTAWEHDPANTALRADLTARLATLYGPEGYLQFTRPALAALYARNAFPRRAEREYRAILAEHPERADIRLAFALVQWQLGRLPETVAACSALLAEQPQLVRARWALADALARRGDGEAARAHAIMAAPLDPDGGIARDLIAANPDAAIVDPDEPLVARASPAPEGTRAHLRLVKREAAPADMGAAAPRPALQSPDALAALPNPQDTPYAGPASAPEPEPAPPPPDRDRAPEPVVAVVEEDGQIIATMPGGEPSLDATDVLPNPPAPVPTGEGGDVGAHSRAPSGDDPPATDSPVAAMRARMAAGDYAGMVGGMRGLLAVAGEDAEQVRALLPALRLLVDALHRPDAHRLLGDAYRRLALYPQAEGQYRQALLIRVAGKDAGK